MDMEQTRKISIYIPDFLVRYIDQFAEERGWGSRSKTIRYMVDEFIYTYEHCMDYLQKEEQKRLQEEQIRLEEDRLDEMWKSLKRLGIEGNA